jgi:3-(methylthio)propanoyl-CoA dehydrogenase
VHGGMGFVEEGGAAQFYRDARIAPIYEGTNGIQAIDLYGRKLLSDRGEAMHALISDARDAGAAMKKTRGARLVVAADALEEATTYMLSAVREDALAGAADYLALAGDVAGGLYLARGIVSAPGRAAMTKEIIEDQTALFAFYSETVLARAPSRLPAIQIGLAALAVNDDASSR